MSSFSIAPRRKLPSRIIRLLLAASILIAGVVVCTAAKTLRPEASMIFDRVRDHEFNPIKNDDQSFTIDRSLRKHGIADLADTDWRVRLLALRDLVRLGIDETEAIAAGLDDDDLHVRSLSAMALGIRKAQSTAPSLERLLREDPEPIVRAYAAMVLGQMLSKDSIVLLLDRLANDPHRDVRHQCELAAGQIERGLGATPALRQAFVELDESTFESLRVGGTAPPFVLDDTEGQSRSLDELRNGQWIVLIWVFADWCPVCHGEFRELMELRDAYEQAGVRVATVEAHDVWRGRVMVGKEIEPEYWFAKESFKEAYANRIWWPHLLDRAGAVGSVYGVDPLAFAVHGEFINRPSTIIVDPEGIVRFAYYGTYWGDRPSIAQTLDMIRKQSFDFEHTNRLDASSSSIQSDK